MIGGDARARSRGDRAGRRARQRAAQAGQARRRAEGVPRRARCSTPTTRACSRCSASPTSAATSSTQARPIYEDLVERAPTDASHRLNLGLVYLKLGDGDEGDQLARGEPRARSEPGPRGQLPRPRVRARRPLRRGVSLVPARRPERARERDRDQPHAAERDGIHAQLGAARPSTRGRRRARPPSSRSRRHAHLAAATRPRRARRRRARPPRAIRSRSAAAPRRSTSPAIDRRAARRSTSRPARAADDASRCSSCCRRAAPGAAPASRCISAAVAVAVARRAPRITCRTPPGGTPPIPLSQLATDELVRPDDGDDVVRDRADRRARDPRRPNA